MNISQLYSFDFLQILFLVEAEGLDHGGLGKYVFLRFYFDQYKLCLFWENT